MNAASTRVVEDVVAWNGDTTVSREDLLTVEEPLEIRFAGLSVAVTMRTPGDDFDLALGFLFTEGIIHRRDDVASIAYCPSADAATQGNIVNVHPAQRGLVDPQRWQRHFFSTSSCGICGKASIDAIHQQACAVQGSARISHQTLYRLDERLRTAQQVFAQTGGLHAAGLFDLDGELITLREDVGRHNAVDKVIGDALGRAALPLDQSVLVVSSRASFEVTQKALMAGIPILAAVSAPSSLAIDLARSANMTLIGFLRSGRCNIYTGAERVI
jgi:FdhD protein